MGRTMIRSLSWMALALACAACAALQGAPDERVAVLATLDSWDRGWAEGDASLAVADYAHDADWTNAFGDRFVGRDELQDGLEFIFGLDFVMAGTSQPDAYREVTFLSDDVAMIRSHLVRTGQRTGAGQPMPDRRIHHLRVLEKRAGRWLIVSHLISQAQEKSAPFLDAANSEPEPMPSFLPRDVDVPAGLETPEFRLRMLTIHDAVKDFDAVVSSAEHLATIWPGSTWPEGLTLEQNLIDLAWHQKEFQMRSTFAYTVVTPSEDRVLGCVYIDPSRKVGYDAEVYLWARQSELAGGLEERLHAAVKEWMTNAWPFERAAFPGRDIDWTTWNALPDNVR